MLELRDIYNAMQQIGMNINNCFSFLANAAG